MRLGVFLATSIGVATWTLDAGATDATWTAVSALADGVSPYCAGGQFPGPEWTGPDDGQVTVQGNTLTYTSRGRVPNRSFTLDLAMLKPDGSGTVAGRDSRNREFLVRFDAGTGARPFEMTSSVNACRRVFTPRT